MTEQDIICEVCEKENNSALYDIKIDEVPIYSMIRGDVRYRIIESHGLPVMSLKSALDVKAVSKSILVSLWHILRLCCSKRKYSSIYYAFARIDKVGDYYLDKFTDPLIDQCEKDGSFLILDYGRAGVHPKPRAHAGNIVYLDMLSALSRLYGMLFYKYFLTKYTKEFSLLFQVLKASFGIDFNKHLIVKEVAGNMLFIHMLQFIFKKVGAERVIGPARAFMAAPFIAAKRQMMKTFELQHGITYGETVLYSGYRDEMIVPDYFLAFGNNHPLNVYGIDETRIVNIGWAFQDYIAKIAHGGINYGPNDVLVVSDPEITVPLLKSVIMLAKEYPDSTFYFRPHPHEHITKEHENMIAPFPNIKIQDYHINITMALQMFNLVLGENSTVMYEALAIRKKVGRLFFEGLNPLYTSDEDRDYFWEIHNCGDFGRFIKDDISIKKTKSIYSPFDINKYMTITGITA